MLSAAARFAYTIRWSESRIVIASASESSTSVRP